MMKEVTGDMNEYRTRRDGPGGILLRLLRDEDGGIMGNIIFLGILTLVIGILVIDGIAVFSTYRRVEEVTDKAARQAKFVFDTEKSDVKAENAAADTCETEGMVFEEFEIRKEYGHTYKISCSMGTETYVFKYIPKLKELTRQQSTAYTSEA